MVDSSGTQAAGPAGFYGTFVEDGREPSSPRAGRRDVKVIALAAFYLGVAVLAFAYGRRLSGAGGVATTVDFPTAWSAGRS